MKIILKFLCHSLFVVLLGGSAQAKVRIAFLETYDANGHLVQYEPGGRFSHSAIQFDELGNQWLNAYPVEGVAIISLETLQHHGKIADVVEIPVDLTMADVQPYLGKPFDYWYSWSDDAIYCSELIGKLLHVPTKPLHLNHEVWPKNYWKLEGTPGLSPDELWRWAKAHSVTSP